MILLATADTLPGLEIETTLGLVRGSAMRTRHIFTDIAEWLRNLVGAELHHYTKMMGESREQALDRMRDHARQLNADAIVSIRFAFSHVAGGSAEVLVYGTAVRLRPAPGEDS